MDITSVEALSVCARVDDIGGLYQSPVNQGDPPLADGSSSVDDSPTTTPDNCVEITGDDNRDKLRGSNDDERIFGGGDRMISALKAVTILSTVDPGTTAFATTAALIFYGRKFASIRAKLCFVVEIGFVGCFAWMMEKFISFEIRCQVSLCLSNAQTGMLWLLTLRCTLMSATVMPLPMARPDYPACQSLCSGSSSAQIPRPLNRG